MSIPDSTIKIVKGLYLYTKVVYMKDGVGIEI
jgi:hypothetical protein